MYQVLLLGMWVETDSADDDAVLRETTERLRGIRLEGTKGAAVLIDPSRRGHEPLLEDLKRFQLQELADTDPR